MDYCDPNNPLFLLKIAETCADLGGIFMLLRGESPLWWATMAIGGQLLLRFVSLVQHAAARPNKFGDIAALTGGAILSFVVGVEMIMTPCVDKYPGLCAWTLQIVIAFMTTLLLLADLVLTLTHDSQRAKSGR